MIMYFQRLQQALPEVRGRIAEACDRAGRADAESIAMVAVTKGHPVEALEAVRAAGLRIIGENRVQEARAKREQAGDLGLAWHMVGHLQRNKVTEALGLFELIQSVDSLRLARRIAREAGERARVAEVLVEVNAAGEEQKYGFAPGATIDAVRAMVGLDALRIVGLMTMAPLTEDEDVLRATFRRVRDLYDRCRDEVQEFEPRHLSMGMTNDFEIAVEEGSTMVRLGTALFGERVR